ncbi:MAG: hypothetical protein AB7U35_05100 [Sphingobium sp.]
MPTPTLLQALSRLDQAISRTESALANRKEETGGESSPDSAAIRAAIAEIDGLIESLGVNADG